jgi:hypothetical protein
LARIEHVGGADVVAAVFQSSAETDQAVTVFAAGDKIHVATALRENFTSPPITEEVQPVVQRQQQQIQPKD